MFYGSSPVMKKGEIMTEVLMLFNDVDVTQVLF
jgi:hypothetical protein